MERVIFKAFTEVVIDAVAQMHPSCVSFDASCSINVPAQERIVPTRAEKAINRLLLINHEPFRSMEKYTPPLEKVPIEQEQMSRPIA